jgi:3D (Asp-Asp-Asp) domain-containing protein
MGIVIGVLLGSLIGGGILFGLLPLFADSSQNPSQFSLENPQSNQESQIISKEELPPEEKNLITFQQNTLISLSSPYIPEKQVHSIKVIATAYSSTPWETDEDPFITASGTQVRDGIIANNYLPMGTKIRIPQLFGDKVFVVEDRMHWTKSNYHIDIWFPSYQEALNFGAKNTYIEILEN